MKLADALPLHSKIYQNSMVDLPATSIFERPNFIEIRLTYMNYL